MRWANVSVAWIGMSLVVGLKPATAACPLGEVINVDVRCEPAAKRAGLAIRHCFTNLPDGFVVVSTAPTNGVSTFGSAPLISIVTDSGPFVLPRAAYVQWATPKLRTASGAEQLNYIALANSAIWGKQTGRQYYQLLNSPPEKCSWHDCERAMNSYWAWPSAKALCAAPNDFKPTK